MKRIKMVMVAVTVVMLWGQMAHAGDDGKHMFILSGQSNMRNLKMKDSFHPMIKEKFGDENIITVKMAWHGQPIRLWYKDWKDADGNKPEKVGNLYDIMMKNVNAKMKGQKVATVTFIWMQGERDAAEKHGGVYAQSLEGLVKQLSKDIKRDDINVVIGRLSDFDMKNEKYPHWTMIRDIQVELADSHENWAWVDTDSFNDVAKNGNVFQSIHYTQQGYIEFGKRLAEESIKLIQKQQN
jgi:hypothetical protein